MVASRAADAQEGILKAGSIASGEKLLRVGRITLSQSQTISWTNV